MNSHSYSNKTMLLVVLLTCQFLPGISPNIYATQPLVTIQQQMVKVTGTVSDALGAVVGASVLEQGTTNGVVTDINGNFTLTVSRGAKLEISFVGYKSQIVTVKDSNPLQITLEEDWEILDEVVVVGYGVQKKKLVTGATVQVKGDDVAKLNTTSALGALQNQTPGINITANNGQPGEGFKVNIRGIGTVGDSSPLYVIDGVAGSDINTLNPADIESIDVLKDAASAAIYGSRAANGVILVTTKQGKSGKIQVSYDMYYGWQNIYKMPNTLNARQYMALTDEANFNNGTPALNWHTQLGDYTWNMLQNGWQGTNWLEEMRNKNAAMQNHAINLAGGNETSKFSAGFSFTSQDGIIGKDEATPNYTRYTARINSDHVVLKGNDRDIIKVGENILFYYARQNTIAQSSTLYNDVCNAIQGIPVMPMTNATGELFDYTDMQQTGWVYDDKQANPVLLMQKAHGLNKDRKYGLNATAYLEVEPIKNLKWRSSFSYRMANNSFRSLTAPYQGSSNFASTGYTVRQDASLGHSISQENTLSYILPKFADHQFDVLIGQSFEKTIPGENLSIRNSVEEGQQLPTMKPDMDHAWLSNTIGNATSNFTGYPHDEWALASFFGRINYNYKDKYMATFIMRADGSSNFARGNRWGIFPSVSAGWLISEEQFMQGTRSWLDFLKLRISWGENGNQSITNFQYVSPVAFDLSHSYQFGPTHIMKDQLPTTGAYATNLANKDITWEKSEQLDLGIDMTMFNNRMRIAADYYVKKTKDWLVQAPVLSTAGTAAPYINGGDVTNKGFELSLSWNDQIGKELNYGFNINASYNKNKVTRIANSEGIIHGNVGAITVDTSEFYRAEEGYPIGYFWGYQTAGVFQNQAEINEWIAAGNGVAQAKPQPGDLIYVDRDHNGIINEDDKTMIGNPHPDWHLGFSFNLGWRGFDFSATASGAFGQQLYYGTRANTIDAFDRWHGEGTSNRYPRLGNSATIVNHVTDIDIENGDYLRMQNITLGYDFKHIWKKCPLSQLRLYISVQNLFTITSYKGMDPEVGFGGTDRYGENATSWVTGIDMGSYPVARSWLVGANLKF